MTSSLEPILSFIYSCEIKSNVTRKKKELHIFKENLLIK